MCFGSPKQPDIQKSPDPSPRPTVTPSESSPAGRQESRAKRIRQYRSGFASTLKTGPFGVNDEKGGKKVLGE